MMKPPLIEHDTLAIRAKNLLHDMIIRGDLRQGQRLTEVQIANQLGISRACIREAFIELMREGLIVKEVNRYTAVVHLTKKDAQDIMEVRNTIEMMALEHWRDCTEKQLVQLREKADALLQYDTTPTIERMICDMKFHEQIVIGSHNERAVAIWRQMADLVMMMCYIACKRNPAYLKMGELHFKTVDALERGDFSAARDVLAMHLRGTMEVSIAGIVDDV